MICSASISLKLPRPGGSWQDALPDAKTLSKFRQKWHLSLLTVPLEGFPKLGATHLDSCNYNMILESELDQLHGGLDSKFFHHPVFMKDDSSETHFKDTGSLFH